MPLYFTNERKHYKFTVMINIHVCKTYTENREKHTFTKIDHTMYFNVG